MKLYPLTKPQLAVRYMEQFFGKSIANITCSVIFNEPVDSEKLNKAINKMIMQCDSLRIRIVNKDGIEFQYINDYEQFDIDVLKFENNGTFEKWAAELAKTPLNIYGCLYKIYIVEICDKIGLAVNLHHLIADAFTINLLFNTVTKILCGKETAVQSYTKFITSENEYENSARSIKDRDYFMSCFESQKEPVYLFDKQVRDIDSKRISLKIENKRTEEITSFCNSENISVYSLFMNALAIYFYRLKGADAMYIGTTIHNRFGKSEKETAGNFINTVPVLLHIDDTISTSQNIKRNTKSISDVLRHQKYHYSEFLKDIRKRYGFSDRLFDIILNYQNTTLVKTDADLKWHFCGCQGESLVIHINDRKNEGIYNFDYDYQTELFSEDDIHRFHRHFMNIIFSLIKEPEKKPYELKLLSDYEYKQIIYDFNNTAVTFPQDKCIHQIFEKQVESTPDKIAVITGRQKLTYQELNEQANVIAHKLIKSGVKINDTVAIKLQRNINLLPAIMGILKSGAAYLPIDPLYPQDRINYILNNSHASLIITEDNIITLLTSNNITNPYIEVRSENLCYLIYTSGSTGTPKGTLITHKNVVNFCSYNLLNVFGGIIKDDMNPIISITTASFDIFVTESLLPLLNGMTVILADEQQSISQKMLNELIISHSVRALQTTPTKMRMLINDNRYVEYLKYLKVIILGGEALDSKLAATLKTLTDAAIYNIYGPTETTVWSAFSSICSDSDITIGKPIANTQIYILDKFLNPLPVDVIGEIYIAGAGVGKGYLNNKKLTAEMFIDNKFGSGKMYKTGDLAKWRKDGNIEYIGRIDNQIKLRGMRIEFGEIENQLREQENITQAIVTVKTDSSDRQYICAYYTGINVNIETVKSELAKKIPQYMLPHFYIKTEIFPLSPSGKIDRKSLPNPDFHNIALTAEYVKPISDKEKKLVCVMENVLGISHIGMEDNFFDLGGDSLKVIEFIAAASDAGFDFSPQNIYDCKTPAALLVSLKMPAEADRDINLKEVHFQTFELMSAKADRVISLNEYPLPHNIKELKRLMRISRLLRRFEVSGIENIPLQSNFILCPNHQSDLDSFWIWTALETKILDLTKICTLISQEHLNNRLSKRIFILLGGIPVERGGNSASAYEHCLKCIRNGFSILIYPEGTRTRDGKISDFKVGAAKLMIDSKVPIIPVSIDGAFDIFPWNKKLPKFFIGKRLKIKISFGKPFTSFDKGADELTAELKKAVQNLMRE